MTDLPVESVKKYLLIINDSPYGIERPYNALRLAMNLAKRPGAFVSVFLVGDGVQCARKGQKTPEGYYNIERMVQSIVRKGRVSTWGSCADARVLGPDDMIEGVTRGTMDQQGDWTVEADQVIVF